MPKVKTKSGAKKRLRATKSGRIKKATAFGSHLLTKKSQSRKRKLRGTTVLSGPDSKEVSRLLPNL